MTDKIYKVRNQLGAGFYNHYGFRVMFSVLSAAERISPSSTTRKRPSEQMSTMLGALGQAWKRYNEMNSTGPTNINYLDVSATKGTYFAAPVIVNGSNGQFRAVRSSSQIGAYNVLFQANTGNFTCEPAGGNCEGLIR